MVVVVMLARNFIFTRIASLTIVQEMALFPLDLEHFEQDLLIIMLINSLCL